MPTGLNSATGNFFRLSIARWPVISIFFFVRVRYPSGRVIDWHYVLHSDLKKGDGLTKLELTFNRLRRRATKGFYCKTTKDLWRGRYVGRGNVELRPWCRESYIYPTPKRQTKTGHPVDISILGGDPSL